MRLLKILLCKGPLDGHDRPIYDLIELFRRHNINPLWLGLRQSWTQILKSAEEEDVDAIGMSIHTGDPVILLTRLREGMQERGMDDVVIVAGGSGEITFPDVRKKLALLGIRVFLSGCDRNKIVKHIFEQCKARTEKITPLDLSGTSWSRRDTARALTLIEDECAFKIPRIRNKPFGVLIAGSPKVGKSSILNKVLTHFAQEKIKIGALLCDPRGPLDKSAYLGDRIVMQQHTPRDHIFIRSVSQSGGYTAKNVAILGKMINALSRWGARIVFIETIGLGQEGAARLKKLADLFLWVTLPNETDKDTIAKGGIHELADAALLNKIDLESPYNAELSLCDMWRKPYFKISAETGEGISELAKYCMHQYEKFTNSKAPT